MFAVLDLFLWRLKWQWNEPLRGRKAGGSPLRRETAPLGHLRKGLSFVYSHFEEQ